MAINRREFFKYLAGTAMAMFSNYASANEESKRLVKLGEERSKAGDLEGAMRFYEEAMKADPEDDEVWNNIGVILHKKGRYKEAIPYYSKAIVLNPSDCVTLGNMAYNYVKLEKWQEAKHWYLEKLKYCENDAIAQAWLRKLQ